MNFRIIPFDEVTSTNDVAMVSPDLYDHGSILTAQRQTEGRGQRGNRWHSPAGENLMFSLVLEPHHILVERQFHISEMAALAAADAVRTATGGAVECRVKWPNDLYVGDRKVGGILIEHTLHSEYLSRSVIGIGINVRQKKFDPSLPNPTSIALSLLSVRPMAYPAPMPLPGEVLRAFCTALAFRYAQPAADLHRDYMAWLWRGDSSPYPYHDPKTGEFFDASIEGIDRYTGKLTLHVAGGDQRRSYWFKEVEAVL